MTRERIRQIESKALRKLQHHTRADHLKGFVDELPAGAAAAAAAAAAAGEGDDIGADEPIEALAAAG